MIARIWRGWTKPEDAKTYEKLMRDEIFPSIAGRNIEGYRGAELFVREGDKEVEFVTLLRFDSMDTHGTGSALSRRDVGGMRCPPTRLAGHGGFASLILPHWRFSWS